MPRRAATSVTETTSRVPDQERRRVVYVPGVRARCGTARPVDDDRLPGPATGAAADDF